MAANNDTYRLIYCHSKTFVLLLIMFKLGGCATISQLARILGVHREGITAAVYRLKDLGYLTRPKVKGGWMITRQGFDFLNQPASSTPQMSVNPTFALTTTTTMEESDDVRLVVEDLSAEMSVNPTFDSSVKPTFAEVWKAFDEIGITHNHLSEQVAQLPGLTYDGVIKQWQYIKSQGKAWTGLLLQILPTLKPWQRRGHSDQCRCQVCYRERDQQLELELDHPHRKYSDWENG